jgi:hypothetical protein
MCETRLTLEPVFYSDRFGGTFPQNLRIPPIIPVSKQRKVARCAPSFLTPFISPEAYGSLDKTLSQTVTRRTTY